MPKQYSDILQLYISDRYSRIKQVVYTELRVFKAGMSQGSVLGPVLHQLNTSDTPVSEQNTIATFADAAAILEVGDTCGEATHKLQA